MKVVCSKNSLLEGINTVFNVIPAKSTMPILMNILLRTKNNKLELIGTDMEISIKCEIDAEIVDKGSITIPARKINDIVRELPDTNVDIEIDENNRALISCGKTNYKIVCLAEDDFPVYPEVKEKATLTLERGMLNEMLKRVVIAVSKDETRYSLNGVFFKLADGLLTMVATDSHRLAKIEKKIAGTEQAKVEAIVPTKVLSELMRLTAEGEGKVKVVFDDNKVLFSFEDKQIVSQLVEGQFPQYDSVIPSECKSKLTCSREELWAATKRVELMAADKSKTTKFEVLKKGSMLISSSTPDVGEAKDEVKIDYTGDDMTVAYNARYVVEALRVMEEKEVSFELVDTNSPGVMRSPGDDSFLYVIMPIRV